MVTRRDQFLKSIDDAGAAMRERMQAGGQGPQQAGPQQQGQRPEAITTQLQRGLSGLEAGFSTLMRGNSSGPAAPGYQHRPSNLAPPPPAATAGPSSGRNVQPTSPQPDAVRTGPPDPAEGEQLPGYTRRPTSAAPAVPRNMRGPAFGNLPSQEHTMASRNGKIECMIESVGRGAVPVFIRDLADTIRGEVTVRLEKPEPIAAVRIRLKVVARTVIHRQPMGSPNRHPVIDEHLLLEMAETVWEAPPSQGELAKLQGVHAFPYEFRLPSGLRYGNQTMDLPPSFALTTNEYMTGTQEVASIKYYLKVTLARQGLFRPNDRVFLPLIFLQRHERPSLPFERAAAIDALPHATPLPGPAHDPQNWQGRHGGRDVRKGGIFSGGKRGQLDATLLLPTPHTFGTRTPIPFCLRLTSSDASMLPSPGQGIRIELMQRTNIIAQGLDATYETGVGISQDLRPDPDGGGSGNERRFRGTITPTPARTPGFATVGLQVSHAVAVTMGDLIVVVPITIHAWPPLRQGSEPTIGGEERREEEAENTTPPDLPPSYFEVVEMGDRKGHGVV